MGLSHVVARIASRHAHALVVEVPGSWRTRTAAERALVARGWQLALAPADADVLVVCGDPGPRIAEAVEVVWQQMPGPRVRVSVREYDELAARLDEAHAGLLDTDHHRHDAQHRPTASELLAGRADDGGEGHDRHGEMSHDGEDHEQMDHGPGGHGGDDHGGHEGHGGNDHGGHEGHEGHGDMDMSPGGIPLAEGGEDRDGLEMDVLNVRLGPVLPHWPAGLLLHCSLQGDVIVEARAELVDGAAGQVDDVPGPARCMDNVVSLLALAGWDAAAAEARIIRDATLDHGGQDKARLDRLRRKVRRSVLLRQSLRGVRSLSEEDIHRQGLPAGATGDTYDRLVGMLDRAAADDTGERPARDGDTGLRTDHLARLVTGLDLATARLVVASLDTHALRAGHADHGASHG